MPPKGLKITPRQWAQFGYTRTFSAQVKHEKKARCFQSVAPLSRSTMTTHKKVKRNPRQKERVGSPDGKIGLIFLAGRKKRPGETNELSRFLRTGKHEIPGRKKNSLPFLC